MLSNEVLWGFLKCLHDASKGMGRGTSMLDGQRVELEVRVQWFQRSVGGRLTHTPLSRDRRRDLTLHVKCMAIPV